MVNETHAFHPSSESFDDRLNSLHSALEQLAQAKSSLVNSDERLGDDNEKREAVTIFENTLSKAINSFDRKELSSIKDNNLLPEEKMVELIAVERTLKTKPQREGSSDDQKTHQR